MPFAVAARARDDDPTDVVATDRHTAHLDEVSSDAGTVVDGRTMPPSAPEPRTTPLTAVQPVSQPPQRPATQPPSPAPPASWRPPPAGTARIQRGSLLGGLFAIVALGFAAAPYVALAGVGLAALGLRTWSWTAEAARERTWRRGRKWYDVPLAAASVPWYLLVATGGTLMLLVWSATLTLLVGLGLLLFRLPLEGGLLVMGSVLAFSMWWGPGGRRLRRPTRTLVLRTTRSTSVGWAGVTVVGVATALLAYALLTSGTVWDPAGGPPWRQGTVLGDLLRFL